MAVIVFPNVWALTVQDVMTRRPTVIRDDEDLALAEALQKFGRFRHLPVLHDGRVVGVLSQRDLLRAMLLERTATVGEVMTRRPTVVSPTTPLREAVGLMLRRKLGCLPVVEHGALVGIVTESDLVRFAGQVAGAVEHRGPVALADRKRRRQVR